MHSKPLEHPFIQSLSLHSFFAPMAGGGVVACGGEYFGRRYGAEGQNLDSLFADMERHHPGDMLSHDLAAITYAARDTDDHPSADDQVYTANISLTSLATPGIALSVLAAIGEDRRRHFWLEITEQRPGHEISPNQYQMIAHNVQSLRRHGVQFLLDDLANGDDPRLPYLLPYAAGIKFDQTTTAEVLDNGLRGLHRTALNVLCDMVRDGRVVIAEGVRGRQDDIARLLNRFNGVAGPGRLLMQGHTMENACRTDASIALAAAF